MIGFIIGAVIGSVVATNVDLRPIYEEHIQPTIETGLNKLKERTQTPKKDDK